MSGCVGDNKARPAMVDRHGVSIEAKKKAALQRLQQSQAQKRQRELDAQQWHLQHQAAPMQGVPHGLCLLHLYSQPVIKCSSLDSLAYTAALTSAKGKLFAREFAVTEYDIFPVACDLLSWPDSLCKPASHCDAAHHAARVE